MTLKDPSLEPSPIKPLPVERVQFCAVDAALPIADLAVGEFSGRVETDADGKEWTVYVNTRTQYGSGTAPLALSESGLSDDDQNTLKSLLLQCRDTAYERNGLPKQAPAGGGAIKVG